MSNSRPARACRDDLKLTVISGEAVKDANRRVLGQLKDTEEKNVNSEKKSQNSDFFFSQFYFFFLQCTAKTEI